MKKRGFGKGKWNGYGGKPEKNEKIKDTAIRETQEESGLIPKNIKQVATLDFYNQNKKEWDQQVLVFLTDQWEGKLIESEEMKPKWFEMNKLPFDSMWSDDPFWFPLVLKGKKIKAEFLFDDDGNVLNKKVNEI